MFRKMERFGPKIKNFLTFSQNKTFLYFGKRNILGPRLKNFRRKLSELKK